MDFNLIRSFMVVPLSLAFFGNFFVLHFGHSADFGFSISQLTDFDFVKLRVAVHLHLSLLVSHFSFIFFVLVLLIFFPETKKVYENHSCCYKKLYRLDY